MATARSECFDRWNALHRAGELLFPHEALGLASFLGLFVSWLALFLLQARFLKHSGMASGDKVLFLLVAAQVVKRGEVNITMIPRLAVSFFVKCRGDRG